MGHLIPSLTLEKTQSANRKIQLQLSLPLEDGGTAIFDLRPSSEVAKKTTNLFEIWDGETRCDPIGVTPAE